EAAEALLYRGPVQPHHFECLDHRFRQMIADAARRDLEAVADHVVLERLDRQRLGTVQRVDTALRHGERVVGEVDLLLVLVPFEERKIDDPAELESFAIDEVQLLAGAGAGSTGERRELLRVSGDEESSVAVVKAELLADGFGTLLADVLGDRASAFELLALLAPEDIAQSRLALPLSPGIHAVAEGPAAAGLRRNGPDLGL